jgi:hypothetical protein
MKAERPGAPDATIATGARPPGSLQRMVRRLRGGIVLVASPAGGIGGVKIDRDLKATEVLMMEAADEIEIMRAAIIETLEENRHLADGENCTLIRLKRALPPNTRL